MGTIPDVLSQYQGDNIPAPVSAAPSSGGFFKDLGNDLSGLDTLALQTYSVINSPSGGTVVPVRTATGGIAPGYIQASTTQAANSLSEIPTLLIGGGLILGLAFALRKRRR